MIDIETFLPLIYFAVIVTPVMIGLKWYLSHRKLKVKAEIAEKKKAGDSAGSEDMDEQIDNLLNNLPAIIKDRESILSKMTADGTQNTDAYKSVESQLKMLRTAQQWEPMIKVAKPIAMPIIKKVVGMVGGL